MKVYCPLVKGKCREDCIARSIVEWRFYLYDEKEKEIKVKIYGRFLKRKVEEKITRVRVVAEKIYSDIHCSLTKSKTEESAELRKVKPYWQKLQWPENWKYHEISEKEKKKLGLK